MSTAPPPGAPRTIGPLAVLARLRDAPPAPVVRAGERCELCAVPLDDHHGHLVDLEHRSLRCACRGCWLLFTADGAGGARFRAVPERVVSFPGVQLTPSEWEALQIPVSIAFFFTNSTLGRVVAFYPGPAGTTESLLALEAWEEVTTAHPELTVLLPDVEALLVRAPRGGGSPECFGVPIDSCYELAGALRTSWRGFDGGSDAHAVVDTFFDRVRVRSRPAPAADR